MDQSTILDELRQNIRVLDNAVTQGSLSKSAISIDCADKMTRHLHFYCQLGLEAEMDQLAQQIVLDISHPDAPCDLPKDYGEYFGYSHNDISLFQNGGYEALQQPMRFLMERTHAIRHRCRIASALGTSPFNLGQ